MNRPEHELEIKLTEALALAVALGNEVNAARLERDELRRQLADARNLTVPGSAKLFESLNIKCLRMQTTLTEIAEATVSRDKYIGTDFIHQLAAGALEPIT